MRGLHTFVTITFIPAMLMLAACGGGSGGPDVTIEGPQLGDITPNSVLLSDMLISGPDGFERASDVSCTPSFSRCRATVQRRVITFTPETDPDGSGVIYQTLGEWDDLRAAAIYAQIDGYNARYGVVGGIVHPNSIPTGTATWTGDMVGLDTNNRTVRGGASITLADFGNPRVDVLLTPQARAAMQWRGLALVSGRFADDRAATDYIKGEFYGPNAEEAGGVFERNGIVGAFGAEQ